MSDASSPVPVGRFEWERLIRRARLPSTAKLVGYALGTYADRDGGRVHPGVERLEGACGLSDRAIRGALKTLRDLELLERTSRGSSSGRRNVADTYRLSRPADVFARLELLDPEDLEPDAAGLGAPAPPAGGSTEAPAPPAGGSTEAPAPQDRPPASDDINHRHHVPPTRSVTNHIPGKSLPQPHETFARATGQRGCEHCDGGWIQTDKGAVKCPSPTCFPPAFSRQSAAAKRGAA